MRVRNFKSIAVAFGFFLALGAMAMPAYAHGWKGHNWAMHHRFKAHRWAMHHPFKARHFAMMHRRRMRFMRNHRYYNGARQRWAHNNWWNNGSWAQNNGYGRWRDDDRGNEGYNNGYYNNAYGAPFLGSYYGPGNWSNGGGYYGPGNRYGHGDDDGD